MAKQPTPKVVTKKHLARLEKERLQQRYLLIGLGVVIVLILAIILYGVLDQAFFKQMRPVARVGNETVSAGEFQKEVRFSRYRLIDQLRGMVSDPVYVQFFGSYIQQIQSQLASPNVLGQDVLDSMVENLLVEKEAAERGITISAAELDKAVEEAFGFYENGTPTPTITATPFDFSTATLSPTQLALVPPTATAGPAEAVTETPAEPLATATLDATAEAAATAAPADAGTPTPTVEPTITQTPTITPTPTQYTRDLFEENFTTYSENVKDLNITKEDLREFIRYSLLRQKVYEAVTQDVETSGEQLWARHILVATEEEAQAVLNRLSAGESFADLAKELSTDTSNKDQGGDLEWFGRGAMVPEFEDAVYQLEIGEISQPVQTQFGYHIIQLLGREVRPLTPEQIEQAKQQAYDDWLEAEKAATDVTTYDTWIEVVPTDPEIPADVQAILSQLGTQ